MEEKKQFWKEIDTVKSDNGITTATFAADVPGGVLVNVTVVSSIKQEAPEGEEEAENQFVLSQNTVFVPGAKVVEIEGGGYVIGKI